MIRPGLHFGVKNIIQLDDISFQNKVQLGGILNRTKIKPNDILTSKRDPIG
jgi:hypothetical protein